MNFKFILKGDSAGNIIGYDLSIALKAEDLTISMKAGQNGQNGTCSISADLPDMLQMVMDGTFRYVKSVSGTLREPSADSHINDLNQLLQDPVLSEK